MQAIDGSNPRDLVAIVKDGNVIGVCRVCDVEFKDPVEILPWVESDCQFGIRGPALHKVFAGLVGACFNNPNKEDYFIAAENFALHGNAHFEPVRNKPATGD